MRRQIAVLLASFSIITASTPALALDLSDAQKQVLSQAENYLKNLETNLDLAISSVPAGTDQPTGSKARLAKMRLAQAKAYIEPAEKALAELPADDQSVQAAQARLDNAKSKAQAFEDRLNGKTATPKTESKPAESEPEPAAKAEPEADPNAKVRLDYRQEDQLKGARFNLNQVEGYNKSLYELVNKIQGVENKDTVDHRELLRALNTISEAKRKAGFAADSLAPLPANGRGVEEELTRLETARANTKGAEDYLLPIHNRLQQIINPANYPNFRADLERIRGLSSMFGATYMFQSDRQGAADVFAQAPAAKQEMIKLAQTYQLLMIQQTNEGKQIEAAGNGMLARHAEFLALAEQQRQALPGEIREHLAEANRYADEAVKEQKPLFFTGGIPQRLEWVDDKFALYEVLDPDNAPALGAEIEQTKASIKKRQKALSEQIIRENRLPGDKYAGADKKRLVEKARSRWLEIEPKAKILKVIMPNEAWKRTPKWTYSNGTWYFSDVSRLQVWVIVQHDKRLAVIRPMNLWIDHTKQDTLTGTSLYTLEDEIIPQNLVLLEHVK